MIKLASTQYQLELLADWEEYVTKITAIVATAKQQDAQLLLFPEYAGVEIACNRFTTEQELFVAVQPLIPQYLDFYQNLAQQYQIHIQPGTIIQEITPRHYANRAYFFTPDGSSGFQDKLQLIEFEKSTHALQPGNKQTLFETSFGKIGIAICYDSEFPEIVRSLVNSGALLILVPSYTNSMAGYHRVFLSCRARAIENQCYVAVSFAVGSAELSGAPEQAMGQSAIVGPADINFPDDGIIAQSKMNEVSMITAELDFKKILTVRKHGAVHNFEDAKHLQNTILQTKKLG